MPRSTAHREAGAERASVDWVSAACIQRTTNSTVGLTHQNADGERLGRSPFP